MVGPVRTRRRGRGRRGRRRSGRGSRRSRPRSRVPPAKRTDTEWYIGEQTRCMSAGPKAQRSASSSKAAGRGRLVPEPRPHPLGPPGGARGVVHGPGQRVAGPASAGGPGAERSSASRSSDGERRLGVVDEDVPLAGEEGGVEQDRHDPHPQGAEHRAEQGGRRRQAEGHPVTLGRARRPSRAPAARRWASSASAAVRTSTPDGPYGHPTRRAGRCSAASDRRPVRAAGGTGSPRAAKSGGTDQHEDQPRTTREHDRAGDGDRPDPAGVGDRSPGRRRRRDRRAPGPSCRCSGSGPGRRPAPAAAPRC